ncbi:ribosomal protein S5, C-terminal domain-containing protein [Bisporella sp. PMI_857]|nr:ribosomal protein S5, C-terminal domain-containing protein [Bisporella sp. PMI_857]
MSVSRPARCLFSVPPPSIRLRCRNFHTSPKLSERRRPNHPSIKAVDMGLIRPQKKPARELFKPYTAEEKAALAKRYTPAQMEAVEAGERAITPEDLDSSGVIRTDFGGLPYLDDFSQYRSVLDKKPYEDKRIDPKARLMTEEEFQDAYVNWQLKIEKMQPEGLQRTDPNYKELMRPNRADIEFRAPYEVPISTGSKGPEPIPLSQFTPDLRGKTDELAKVKKKGDGEEAVDERDPMGVYDLLRKRTGLSLDQILSLKVKILVRHRVVNQTRLGKVASVYLLAIAGDGNGKLGLGQAKGQEAENTLRLARLAAIYNMKPIPRYEERTIYGDVEAKVSAVKVKLMARPPGFGLRCQHSIFEMARAAGIQDLAARVPGARNKMNTIKATYKALTNQRIPDDIARGRGKKLVDVRKVYYGGRV